MFSQETFEYPAEGLHNARGISIKLGGLTYDLKETSVSGAVVQLEDPDFRGQITVRLHRTVRGTGRMQHIEIHNLSLEVEARYVCVIDFSDSIQVRSFPRRNFLSSLRKALEQHYK
jgi:hypothetical protein